MKKFLMMLLSLVTVVSTSLGLVACGEQPTVEFKNDGKSLDTQYADELSAPSDLTKEGHTFLGWYIEGTDTKFDFSSKVEESIVLEARWQVNKYKITFDADGGSAVSEIEDDFGKAVSAPSNPTKTGYTFVGWFEDGATTAYVFDKIPAKNVALKAKWSLNAFSIEFDADGGTAVATITKDFGETVTAPTTEKEGHTFLGWFEEGSETAYVFDTIEARPVSLKAKWDVNSYTITFVTDGSAVAPITQEYGTVISAPVSTKDHYDLIGWFAEGSDTAYVFSTVPADNIVLTARWQVKKYSISFDSNGGTPVDTITQDWNTSVSAPVDPTKEHSEFVGWFEEGSETAYVFDKIEDRDVTLIAKWLGEEFTITYNVNGGNALDSETQTVRYGEQYTLVTPTHPDGYNFAGWIYNENVLPQTGKMPARNISLVASWERTYETTYALYKHNAEHSGRVANTDDVVLDGFNNISKSDLDGKIAELQAKVGDTIEFEIENSNNIKVVANIKLVTAIISTADEFANMVYLSVDEVPSGNWTAWDGYYVLANNIDMSGRIMRKNGRPGTLANAPGWGFRGTIDGNGYAVINLSDTMFYQLGEWKATIKNLSLINMSKPLATAIGGLTIDNCYFEFVIDALHTDGAQFTHVLGDSYGDSSNSYKGNVVIKNSVIKVINNTATKINLINKISDGAENTLTYVNTILVADSTKVGTDDGTIVSKPVTIGLDEVYAGSVEGFDTSIWDTTGNHPTFKKFSYTVLAKSYGYGRYILDRDNGNAAKVNDQDFVATLSGGETITISKDVFNIGSDGTNASPNSSKWKKLVKGSEGNYYMINIVFVHFAVNDAVDAANIAKGLNQANWSTGFGSGMVVMFNNDIDMTGVTVVNGTFGMSGSSGGWGYMGTIDGNGYTISNLAQPLITYTNSACVIKDLTFKNMQAGAAVAYKSSGGKLINVNFDIDVFGMSSLYLMCKGEESRGAVVFENCSIKLENSSSSFVCYADNGPKGNLSYDFGSITLNNVNVKMDAGSFRLSSHETTEYDLTGSINTTIASAVLSKVPVA